MFSLWKKAERERNNMSTNFIVWPNSTIVTSRRVCAFLTAKEKVCLVLGINKRYGKLEILFSKIFWRTFILFVGPLIPLFWISGGFSSGFQSQSGQSYSHLVDVYVMYIPSNSLLVWHMLTSWWPAWQPSCSHPRTCNFDIIFFYFLNFFSRKGLGKWGIETGYTFFKNNCLGFLFRNLRSIWYFITSRSSESCVRFCTVLWDSKFPKFCTWTTLNANYYDYRC